MSDVTGDSMHLDGTVDDMLSGDYRRRFRAEYRQTLIRFVRLEDMLRKWARNELDFQPTCSRDVFERQREAMDAYLSVLEERARIEGVDLK